MLSLLLLTLPVGLLIPGAFRIFPISIVAGLGPPLLYLTATATQHRSVLKRLKSFPLLVIVGFGLSLSTTVAVLEGLFSTGGAFIRTPKLNLSNRRKGQKKVAPYIGWGIVPWMAIYMLGFFYIAGLNLIQHSIKAG
jgi:hypothetical protein